MTTDRPPTTTEAELQAITVGPVQRLAGKIELAESDPAWPALFAREAARIRALLGDDIRLLEHVGSTSVDGLPAKPVIDILLVVDDSGDEARYLPRLEAGGYTLRIREPDWHEHRVCKGPDTNVNLHIFSAGSPEITRMLGFRDRLRTEPDEFDRYLAAKRELAARDWEFVQQYADAKSEVIEAIIARALADPRGETETR
jgi:GrpB-like predicted nucleotidyltransferase (UPF0157 family)